MAKFSKQSTVADIEKAKLKRNLTFSGWLHHMKDMDGVAVNALTGDATRWNILYQEYRNWVEGKGGNIKV